MTQPRTDTLQVGVLISGGGSTLENLIRRIEDGRLKRVRIARVVSSRRAVRGVDIAREANLPVEIIRPGDFPAPAAGPTASAWSPPPDAFAQRLAEALLEARVDVVLMAGFLSLWRFPPAFERRVLNIHPALLPAYGGRGMYGRHVHEAVLAAGERESGCTVHLVDHEFDRGPIIAQSRVPVLAGDTPDTLAERVMLAERELYPHVVQQIADNGVSWLDQFVRL